MELPSDQETLDLVDRIQRGEEGAWDALYRRYHDELLFVVRMNLGKKLRGALESEDVLQSVALAAFRALPDFEPNGPDSMRRFLHTLVLNKIRDRADHFGAQKRAGGVQLTDTIAAALGGDAGPPTYYESERFERLERALRQLPEDMREVVLLRKIDDMPSKEVARLVGSSDAAVRKLYSRAMARLTLLLGEDAAS